MDEHLRRGEAAARQIQDHLEERINWVFWS